MPTQDNKCSLNEEYENMIKDMAKKLGEMAVIYSNLHETIRDSETGTYVGVCLHCLNGSIDDLCNYYGVIE